MFRPFVKHGNGGHAHTRWNQAAAVEEDYGDESDSTEERKDPDYWSVKLPNDDLDRLMWGDAGAPPAAPVARPKCQSPPDGAGEENEAGESAAGKGTARDASGDSDGGNGGAGEGAGNEDEDESNDNAQSSSEKETEQTDPPGAPGAPPVPPDVVILEDIVWKQRSGFGKYSFGLMQHEWEQRRAVLFESGILRYYALPPYVADPGKIRWVYDPSQEPRGEMDLMDRTFDDGDGGNLGKEGGGAPIRSSSSSHSSGLRHLGSFGRDKGLHGGGVKIKARQKQTDPGPTPFEIDIMSKDKKTMWRFCFQSQSMQIEWLSALKSMASGGDDDSDSLDDDDDDEGGGEGLANHGFRPGDHVIRWEMLPVMYPIQIHGIVLEAGKNCVIIADFGLASYDNRAAPKGLDTFDEKEDSHDVIMAAWEKMKPKTKRLNVIVVTERKEIRKWSKISYGNRGDKKKKKNFLSLLPFPHKSSKKAGASEAEEEDGAAMDIDGGEPGGESNDDAVEGAASDSDSDADGSGHPHDEPEAEDPDAPEGEPEWFRPGYERRRRRAPGAMDGGQSVFSLEGGEGRRQELPESDSAALVLARTHFVLENEDLLPKYHVFYSNSECIAVWCKTGRWSTLQAAVYLMTSTLGLGKSAVMVTISAAAAHAILVPALAVGGLAVVGAPMLYLKRSQDKWDRTTMRLTDHFWSRARPEVFVEAIEYWGSLS